jgi:hypothetical protein
MARQGLFSSIGHAVVIATVAAVALAAVEPAVAKTGPAGKGPSAAVATRDATDFSARRRVVHRGGGRAAAAAFAGVVGTGLAVAAAQNRGAYDGDWRCSPVYCGPRYYGGPRYDGGYGYGAPIFPGW